jgi:hypothetical protein
MNELMNYAAPESPSLNPAVTTAMGQSREAQEVQAAVFMAKRFPRNENTALSRITQSCQRLGLASKAVYTYPRGNQNVTGPSIRLAEAIAQAWGNIQCGVVELEQRPGESTCMSYCWDIETNTRDCRVFTVPHIRQTRNGVQTLTDPRDIYELVANQGARRKRACILAVIPKDVVDYAVEACQKTLSTAYKEPLIDRLRNMVNLFQKNYSVPLESIEKYMGYTLDAFTEMDGATLAGIYNALKDGTAKREDYFVLPKTKSEPIDSEEEKSTSTKPKKVSLNDL